MTTKVRALRAFMYEGRRIEAGQVVRVADALAVELVSWLRAEFVDASARAAYEQCVARQWFATDARPPWPGRAPTIGEWIRDVPTRTRNWIRRSE